jgi:hypothetical protein
MTANFLLCLVLAISFIDAAEASDVSQRMGRYTSSEGESRSLLKVSGRVDAPQAMSGNLQTSFNMSASSELASYEGQAVTENDYIKKNFTSGRKTDSSMDGGIDWIYGKRSEVSVGASRLSDSVTVSQGVRGSLGQWLFGDQLRVGFSAQRLSTTRPGSTPLDKDAVTLTPSSRLETTVYGTSIKSILNPTTIVTADVASVISTDRPPLQSYAAGLKQFFPDCSCAVHADAGRVINLGKLTTNMTTGELTAVQWSLAYLQTFPGQLHGRLGYRYAREDEFTRAYQDHLVFGADSYSGALSKDVVGLLQQPVTLDLAMTRYVHNSAGSATTVEMGAGVKF